MTQSRRTFVTTTGLVGTAAIAGGASGIRYAWAQAAPPQAVRMVQTPVLNIGYLESGDSEGFPIILLHGFPYDVHAWDGVAPRLADAGYRVLVPYLRGYGATRFRDPNVPRTAEQAAIGQDVIDFADALQLPRFALSGFDWGNRAACIASILHPDRVRGFVSIRGYSVQNTVEPSEPGTPAGERRAWYQWYFNTERGRRGLETNRRGICRLLWEEWSPSWDFEEAFNRTAPSFDNPDFVDVVIHSYRHRHLNAPGQERFLEVERHLATRPTIDVPAMILRGGDRLGRQTAESPEDRTQFTSLVSARIVQGAGHCPPCEQPADVSSAMQELLAM